MKNRSCCWYLLNFLSSTEPLSGSFWSWINPKNVRKASFIFIDDLLHTITWCWLKKIHRKNRNIFLMSKCKHILFCFLEASHRDASNEYPQHMFLSRNEKTRDPTVSLNLGFAGDKALFYFLHNLWFNVTTKCHLFPLCITSNILWDSWLSLWCH